MVRSIRCAYALALLLLGATPGPVAAAGNPRDPPAPPPAVYEEPSRQEWLVRLAGRFIPDGAANPDSIELRGVSGDVDCINVGAGPGVHCVLNLVWQEKWDLMGNPQFPHPYLDPAMIQIGLGSGPAELHYLLVDKKGIAQGGSGVLRGNMAIFTNSSALAGNATGTSSTGETTVATSNSDMGGASTDGDTSNASVSDGGAGTAPAQDASATGAPVYQTALGGAGSVTLTRIYAPASGRFVQVWINIKHPVYGEQSPHLLLYYRRVAEAAAGGP